MRGLVVSTLLYIILLVIAIAIILVIFSKKPEFEKSKEAIQEKMKEVIISEVMNSRIERGKQFLTTSLRFVAEEPISIEPALYFKDNVFFLHSGSKCNSKQVEISEKMLKIKKEGEYECVLKFDVSNVESKLNVEGTCKHNDDVNAYICKYLNGELYVSQAVAFRNFIVKLELVIPEKKILGIKIYEKRAMISVECKKDLKAVTLKEGEKEVLRICNAIVEIKILKIFPKEGKVLLNVYITDYNEEEWNIKEKGVIKFWKSPPKGITIQDCAYTPYATHCIESLVGYVDVVIPLKR